MDNQYVQYTIELYKWQRTDVHNKDTT